MLPQLYHSKAPDVMSNPVHAKSPCLKKKSNRGRILSLNLDFPVADGSAATELLAGIPCKIFDLVCGKICMKSTDDDHGFSSTAGFFLPQNDPTKRLGSSLLLLDTALRKVRNAQGRKGRLQRLARTGDRNTGLGAHGRWASIAAPNTPALSPSRGLRIRVESEGLKRNRPIACRVSWE